MDSQEIRKSIRAAIQSGDDASAVALINSNPEQLTAMTAFGTWLHVAAANNRLEIVKELLLCGCDLEREGGVRTGTALNAAAAEGHSDVVKYLLSLGASIDTTSPEKYPLYSAIIGGYDQVVSILLEHDVDPLKTFPKRGFGELNASQFASILGKII